MRLCTIMMLLSRVSFRCSPDLFAKTACADTAAYAFTGDDLFKKKAVHIVDKLLPAFDTPTGIPYALVNMKTGNAKNFGWASGGSRALWASLRAHGGQCVPNLEELFSDKVPTNLECPLLG